ncbi:hypothetical protein [Floridanema evergladense]|uniref:Uncharacterized protein n=1 Tax=Floridaenema evergladense BLCC-F167 TaxID=3153639 RepID=A0ABV4WSU0_9CYAN
MIDLWISVVKNHKFGTCARIIVYDRTIVIGNVICGAETWIAVAISGKRIKYN